MEDAAVASETSTRRPVSYKAPFILFIEIIPSLSLSLSLSGACVNKLLTIFALCLSNRNGPGLILKPVMIILPRGLVLAEKIKRGQAILVIRTTIRSTERDHLMILRRFVLNLRGKIGQQKGPQAMLILA